MPEFEPMGDKSDAEPLEAVEKETEAEVEV